MTRLSPRWQFVLVMALLALAYGLLQNGMWWPGSDSEVYLSLARNIAEGRGYIYNGYPATSLSPGYPLVLAAVMSVTRSFWAINGLNALLMLANMALWWVLLRRFVSDLQATLATMIGGLLYISFSLTTMAFSDPFYCVLFTLALLLAVHVRDGCGWRWRVPLLLGLLALSTAVRSAGAMNWVVIAAIVLSGPLRQRLRQRAVAAAAAGVVSVGAYLAIPGILEPRAEAAASAADVTRPAPPRAQEKMASSTFAHGSDYYGLEGWNVVGELPGWLSAALWPPVQLAAAAPSLRPLVLGSGLVALLLAGWQTLRDLRGGQLVWLGVAAVVFGLALRRGGINARYLLPVAPLVLLAVWLGLGDLAGRLRRLPQPATAHVLVAGFLGSVLLANMALYAMEIRVARSSDFYAAFRAGQSRDLLKIADHLQSHAAAKDTVLSNFWYPFYGRLRANTLTIRELNFLTGLQVDLTPGSPYEPAELDAELLQWALDNGYDWYVLRLEPQPWRLYHYRAPWLQRWLTGSAPTEASPYFRLYNLGSPDGPVPLDNVGSDQVTRVPAVVKRANDQH